MAVQSKIPNCQQFAQSEQSFNQTFTSPTMLMASDALIPVADPFASNIVSISHDGHAGMHSDNYYGLEPCDGNTVWYCSACGDGPIGSWNPNCTSCGHVYCGACIVEKTA